jgi:uncharacterized membrane protein
MVSDFPMVLLLAWAGLDGAALVLESASVWQLARWALVAGLVSAGLAALAGFIDFIALSEDTPRAGRTATVHMSLMLTAVGIALATLVFRTDALPSGLGRVLEAGALVLVASCLGAGGWFGGHLVFHYGVGRSEQAE